MAACNNDAMTHDQPRTGAPEPQAASDSAFEAAYQAAQKSLAEGGIPIGAALAREGLVIASGHNERVQGGRRTSRSRRAGEVRQA